MGSDRKINSCLGTTHSDYWYGKVPVTGYLKNNLEYEKNTGYLIVNLLNKLKYNTTLVLVLLLLVTDHFVGEKLLIALLIILKCWSLFLRPLITLNN